ncbi:MAG: tetratricopeptide repeat protein [Cytophagaceae bacterium]|nr:tetratricopeptide repeat protein [Cytophagaceae bacterium]
MSLNYSKTPSSYTVLRQALWGLLILLIAVACKTSKPQANTAATPAPAQKEMPEDVRVAFESAFNEGMKQYILGDNVEATKYFEKAIVINNVSAAAFFVLGKLYFLQNDVIKARAYSEEATELDTQNPYYLEQLAHVYEYQQLYNEAEKTYRKLIALTPNEPEYYYDMAAMSLYQNKPDDALKTYTVIENKFGKNLEITRQKQQLLLKVNKTDEAIKEGQGLINAYPDEFSYQIAQAEFLYTNGKNDEAITILNHVIQQDPENLSAHLSLANVYEIQNNTDKAFTELLIAFKDPALDLDTRMKVLEDVVKNAAGAVQLEQAEQLTKLTMLYYPSEAKGYDMLGAIYLKENKNKEALETLKKALKYKAGDYNNWVEVLNLEYSLHQYDSLIVDTDRALELFPNQAVIWYYGGMGSYMKKDYTKAVKYLDQSKKLASTQVEVKIMALCLMGDAYNELKNHPKSDESYEEVLKMDRNNDHALNNYSYFLSLRKEKLELAKDLSERLMKKYPGNPSYIDTYGWVLYQLKDYVNAKKYLEVAMSTSKKAVIVEHYGDVLYQLGEKENAIASWKEAKQLGGASELIHKKIHEGKLYE